MCIVQMIMHKIKISYIGFQFTIVMYLYLNLRVSKFKKDKLVAPIYVFNRVAILKFWKSEFSKKKFRSSSGEFFLQSGTKTRSFFAKSKSYYMGFYRIISNA